MTVGGFVLIVIRSLFHRGQRHAEAKIKVEHRFHTEHQPAIKSPYSKTQKRRADRASLKTYCYSISYLLFF